KLIYDEIDLVFRDTGGPKYYINHLNGKLLPRLLAFYTFKPGVPVGHDEYEPNILAKHYRCFGPFPVFHEEIAAEPRLAILMWIMNIPLSDYSARDLPGG
ncbi:uncharacterized protein ARB_03726, partial [Trichophyton benhamiae CBS 112371]